MRVAIAGSRRLPAGQAPRLLVRTLAALPDGTTILLRRGISIPPGMFESELAQLASILRLGVHWFQPEPTDETPGRASVFVRDIDMVESADLVILFLTPEEASDGGSGTAHLMDKALDAAIPVYAYAVDRDGSVERVGEYDPDHLYVELTPSPGGAGR